MPGSNEASTPRRSVARSSKRPRATAVSRSPRTGGPRSSCSSPVRTPTATARARKREFRRLWITRINAGAREHGLSYNQLMHGLKEAKIDLDRKMLADLAVREPEVFAEMAARAKEALGRQS